MDSILGSVKVIVNVPYDYVAFNDVLIAHTNSALAALTQLGVGPEGGYRITSERDTWSDFLREDELALMAEVQDYVGLRVRMLFDPPANSVVAEAYNKGIDEYAYRLMVAATSLKQPESPA